MKKTGGQQIFKEIDTEECSMREMLMGG